MKLKLALANIENYFRKDKDGGPDEAMHGLVFRADLTAIEFKELFSKLKEHAVEVQTT